MAPQKRRPRPGGIGRGPLELIAADHSDFPEHSPPARRRSRRPIGPGELAVARELRRRGLHLKLIEAWRP